MGYKNPEDKVEYDRLYYQQHRDKLLRGMRHLYYTNREKRLAIATEYRNRNREVINERFRNSLWLKEYIVKNKDRRGMAQRHYQQRRKLKILTHYSQGEPRCVRCGFTDIRALKYPR